MAVRHGLFILIVLLAASCGREEHSYGPRPHGPDRPEKTESVTKSGTLVRTSAADPCIVYYGGKGNRKQQAKEEENDHKEPRRELVS